MWQFFALGYFASVLKTIREAIRGTHADYTEAPVGRALVLLAVPMVLEMVLESLFAVVDIFFVAHLGADAIATVGLTESMMALVYALAMGLGIGAAATVARRIGEKDPDGAAHTAAQALILGLLVSLPVAIIGVIFAPQLLGMLGAEASVREHGAGFTRVMLGGNVVIIMLFLINAIFRGAGDAAIAMRSLWLASACNIVLGPLFIFGVGPFPRLGVMGAAIGTTIGRGIGVAYQMTQLHRRDGRILIEPRHLALDLPLMGRLLKLSSTGIVQMLIGTTSWIGLVRVLAGFGSVALAGYTITIRIVIFALLPVWGLSNAAATMVGQNLGAKRPERAAQAVWKAAIYSMGVLGVIGLAFVALAPWVARIFTSDPFILPYAATGLRIISTGFVFYGAGMVFSNAFNGAGDTWTPTLLNAACFWGLEVPLAWFLAYQADLGPYGVYWAIAIAFSIFAVAGGVLFKRGAWQRKVV